MAGVLAKQPMRGVLSEPVTANPILMRQMAGIAANQPAKLGGPQSWDEYGQMFTQNLQQNFPTNPRDPGFREAVKNMAMNFAPMGITVFHGSPHRFDKFDINKTGQEGAGGTSFGLGINLSKDVNHANAYKGKDGNLYRVDLPDESLKTFIKWESPVDDALAKQLPALDMSKPIPFGSGATIENVGGQWLLKSGDTAFKLGEKEVMRMFGSGNTGEQVYRRLVASLGGDQRAASEWLKAQGVKGIANSTERGAENFVVFDDKLPKIIGRE